ncbi:LysR family transcriptional regulator [Alcaligenaceae bacterium]|nr:LysR family transcriptional regulator [Alcaligenaceae bacterium]
MPQLKLLEDFIALARAGSFVRAAEQRHVTHPAFGRRIKALESWIGAPLVNRSTLPATLTEQGETVYRTACQIVEQLNRVRYQARNAEPGGHGRLRIATGRSLARTLVADWIARLYKGRKPVLKPGTQIDVTTGMMADMARLLAQGKIDLLCCYEHPALSTELLSDQFTHMTLAIDKLVPVCHTRPDGTPRYALSDRAGTSLPLITYACGLAMARILGDRLQSCPYPLVTTLSCDSPDTAMGSVLKGLGIAWLPLSMVTGECRRGVLTQLGGRGDEIAFEVRLYRLRGQMSDLAEAVWSFTQQSR